VIAGGCRNIENLVIGLRLAIENRTKQIKTEMQAKEER